MTGTAQPKIFTIWSFTEKVCQTLFKTVFCGDKNPSFDNMSACSNSAPPKPPCWLRTSQDGQGAEATTGDVGLWRQQLSHRTTPRVFSPPHIQPGKQNQGSVVGNRTLATFKTTERKLKIKKTFTYSHEVRIHRDRMQNGGCHRLGGRGKGKWYLMGTEFWFCKLKKFWRLHNKGNIFNPTEVHT